MNWFIAQVLTATENVPPLTAVGLLTAVLSWFMYQGMKIPKELRILAHRLDGLTRALLVDMTERDSAGIHVKKYAREEIAKIDERMNR